MSDEHTVGDFVTLRRGTTYKGALVGEPGPALLGLGSIVPGGGFRSDYKTYGGDCPPELMLLPGDLFVSLKGATKDGDMIGSIARVPASVPMGRVTQDTVKLVFHERSSDLERYLYWILRTPQYRTYCAARATGSAVVGLSREDFLSYPVPALTPPRRHLVAVLENIEEKLGSNQRSIACLQELIRLHFQAALQSGEARHVPLGEVVAVTKGRSYKSAELVPSTTALVTLKSIDRSGGYKPDGLKPYAGPYKPEQVVEPGDLVVAQTDLTQGAEVVGRGVRVPRSNDYATLVASLDLAIVRPVDGMPSEYLIGLLTSEDFRQHCRSRTSGTTVLHLGKDAIPTWPAPLIAPEDQEAYASVVRPLFARMDALRHEQERLDQTRVALLPELHLGRVSLRIAREVA